jgi:hypothetical protein
MSIATKVRWLRPVLLLKVLACLFVWGLPALLAPPAVLALFGIEMPADPVFLRTFGAVVTAVSFLYWVAYRDPLGNMAILHFGVLDNGLAALTLVILALTSGLAAWFYWVSLGLLLFFFVALVLLLPRGEGARRPASS